MSEEIVRPITPRASRFLTWPVEALTLLLRAHQPPNGRAMTQGTRRFIPAVAILVCLAGCGSETPTAPAKPQESTNATSPTAPTVSSVLVSGAAWLVVGGTTQLTALARFSDGSPSQACPTTPIWQSANPAVATVSAAGLVTTVAVGETYINGTC
jgi:hypothetical protein